MKRFCDQRFVRLVDFYHACYMIRSYHPSWFNNLNNIW
jgi:hypothetical protein